MALRPARKRLPKILSFSDYVYPDFMVAHNGVMFISVYMDANVNLLWKSDGTAAGTSVIPNLINANNFAETNGTILFSAVSTEGHELWKYEPQQVFTLTWDEGTVDANEEISLGELEPLTEPITLTFSIINTGVDNILLGELQTELTGPEGIFTVDFSGVPALISTNHSYDFTISFLATEPGDYALYVTVPTNDKDALNFSFSVEASIEVITATEQSLSKVVAVYPNITSGNFYIQTQDAITPQQISVIDVSGKQQVFESIAMDNNRLAVHLQHTTPGIYLVTINSNKGRITRKLFVR